jgi:hypothetical protein
MDPIRFNAVVGSDKVIRPPAGVTLPEGAIEVTVRPVPAPPAPDGDPGTATREWLLRLAADVERAAPQLPADLAEHHDHYAHGKPLP